MRMALKLLVVLTSPLVMMNGFPETCRGYDGGGSQGRRQRGGLGCNAHSAEVKEENQKGREAEGLVMIFWCHLRTVLWAWRGRSAPPVRIRYCKLYHYHCKKRGTQYPSPLIDVHWFRPEAGGVALARDRQVRACL